MSDKSLIKSIIHLAWPTVVEQAFQSAVQYVDYAMVGRVGTAAVAAIGVTNTVQWLVNAPMWALSTGFLAYIARDFGARDTLHAKKYAAQAVSVSLIFGIILTIIVESCAAFIPSWMGAEQSLRRDAALYFGIVCAPIIMRMFIILLSGALRGVGDTRTPMLINAGINILNVILNYLLIYDTHKVFGITVWGANLGVIGAAVATAISFGVGGVIVLIVFFRHRVISPKGISIKPDMNILKPCLKISIPAVSQHLVTMVGQVVFSSMVNTLGTVAITAHATAITAESAFYIPGYGMQAAASALEGISYGAKDKKRMQSLGRMFLIIVFCLMSVTGALLFLFADNVMSIFSSDKEVIALGGYVLRMVAISEPVYGIAIILEGIFRGVGDTLRPFYYEAITMWGIRILGTFITVKVMGLGLTAAWACMIAHNVALAILMSVHYARGTWNPLNRAS